MRFNKENKHNQPHAELQAGDRLAVKLPGRKGSEGVH